MGEDEHEHEHGVEKEKRQKVKHVWCSPDGINAYVGEIVRSNYQNENGENKSDVYVETPEGPKVYSMGFRDPADFDENGAGLCFWNIVTDVEGSNRFLNDEEVIS
jgi:hypothetical protein